MIIYLLKIYVFLETCDKSFFDLIGLGIPGPIFEESSRCNLKKTCCSNDNWKDIENRYLKDYDLKNSEF